MSEYHAPLQDMRFVIKELAGLGRINQLPGFEGATEDIVDPVLEEAAKLAGEVLAPLNDIGDEHGSEVRDGEVITHEAFAAAYQQFVAGGWGGLSGNPEYNGMGLPETVGLPVSEMWQSANLAFSLCPLLTIGAVDALEDHASEALKQKYLEKMVSFEWSGTMNLTEPQAGSDLAAITTKAVPEGDHYLISGTKIFITWGDQSFSENIIHLVLARLPDAPPGVKGISLFLVPKYLVNDDGSLGERNDVYPGSVEHKMGIHGSPTCVMNYGDNGGAIGYLVGEAHKGLIGMFTMMNHARLSVGLQGVAISERSYQQARSYAKERVQGGVPGQEGRVTIIHHPDVRRMLMLMKSQTEAMRAVLYTTAAEMDKAYHSDNEEERAKAQARMELMIPIAKAWPTETCVEVTSLNVQVHGGMGYIEETGAAQHFRDARILPIYEGTTGIQALDLLGRKILRDRGQALMALIADMKITEVELSAAGGNLAEIAKGFGDALNYLEKAGGWLQMNVKEDFNLVGAISVNFLMLMGVVTGAWQMARAALAAQRGLDSGEGDAEFYRIKLATVTFYMQHIVPRAGAYLQAIVAGSDTVMALDAEQF